MAYILKNTTGLINTRITDTGRQKLSQGNFNIAYFQVGDSELSYDTLPETYDQTETQILEPNYNSQNSVGVPSSNKQYIKYPLFVDGTTGSTYGIPFMDSQAYGVFNTAAPRGFFSGNTELPPVDWNAMTSSEYTISTNYIVQLSSLTGGTTITVVYSGCNTDIIRVPQEGDFITILYDGNGTSNCSCSNLPVPSSTPSPTPSNTPGVSTTPTPTPSASAGVCATPTPTPTPSCTFCVTPTPSKACPPSETAICLVPLNSCYSILTYRIVSVCNNQYTLDRPTPDYSSIGTSYYARTLVYPPTLTSLYDTVTPRPHWNDNVIDFESVCGIDEFDVNIWNMNIPWSENPAGLDPVFYDGYTTFTSKTYLGSKEYLGYTSDSGQTDTSSTYYKNSFDDEITVLPKEQKSIAIIHYTNNTIDSFYGEKFATEPYSDAGDSTGFARHFRLSIPWLMWHKSDSFCSGEIFYVDPEGFDELNLFTVNYIKSNKNEDMNNPGMRYYHLWDTHPGDDGYPNRIGKVFPDQKIVVIDDEEVVTAMSYKSNRNWTLPAPRVALVTPNTQGNNTNEGNGILSANTEYLYVTYMFGNAKHNTMHCNYYQKIQGPDLTNPCVVSVSQNVAVRFGPEFNNLTQVPTGITTVYSGYQADSLYILAQKVTGDTRPDPADWKLIDFTDKLTASTVYNYITQSGMTGNTFVISQEKYDDAPYYDLNDYLYLTPINYTGTSLNFGDEYYFYGNMETDIQATIYEMRYKINLGITEFQATSNPTWSFGSNLFVSEIGLYDSNKNLMVISKMQSPVKRQGIQQFLIKFDF